MNIPDNYIHYYYKLYEQVYNILNQNDIFYNDICRQFTSINIDMNLFERKTVYKIDNLTSCEGSCSYKNVNFEKRNIQCECLIKLEENNIISNNKLNKEEIYSPAVLCQVFFYFI